LGGAPAAPAIAVVHQRPLQLPVVEGLLQGVERQVAAERGGGAPPDNAPGKDSDHEGDVDEATPDRDVGEIGDPQLIGPGGPEVPLHQIPGTIGRGLGTRGAHSATAHDAAQSQHPHQPSDRAAGDGMALAPELLPDLLGAIDAAVGPPDSLDLGPEPRVPLRPGVGAEWDRPAGLSPCSRSTERSAAPRRSARLRRPPGGRR
jgi:hypothetical protein